MVMDEPIVVAPIIDKLPNCWKDNKHSLKHMKEDKSMEQIETHLRIKEEIQAPDGVKDTNTSVPRSTVNMVEVVGLVGPRNPIITTLKPMLQIKRGRPSLVGYAMDLILRGIVLLRRRRRQ